MRISCDSEQHCLILQAPTHLEMGGPTYVTSASYETVMRSVGAATALVDAVVQRSLVQPRRLCGLLARLVHAPDILASMLRSYDLAIADAVLRLRAAPACCTWRARAFALADV